MIQLNNGNKKILQIAIPSIVSNITVPLLGLIDVTIVGHLGSAAYIGAIAVGGMLFNIIYWIFGFLRMGTSGMTSQAYGRHDLNEVTRLLLRSVGVGLLDKAAASLPDIRSNSDHGKPSAGACYALKARVAFYAHKYDVAEAAARKVMGMNVYGLYDNYGDLFQPVAELCNEIIFDREYLENPKNSNEGSYIGQFFAPVMMGGWEALSPTQDLIDSYPCKDGKSIKESPFYNPEDPFANRDPRIGFSVLWNGSQIAGKTFNLNNMGDGSHTRTGYSMKKYINPDNDGINNYDWTNFIYIRYAEVLLTFAEARNENLSAPDTEVYDAVNQIRQRPSVNLPPLPSGLSKDQMREAIRLERRLEFAFEGMHLFDTRSYKTTEKDVTKPVYGINAKGESIFIETRKFNANRDYLWAIPLEEVDLAQGALKQNPGWD